MRWFPLTCAVTAMVLALRFSHGSAQAADGQASDPADREKIEFFETRIHPILERNCYKCHGTARTVKGGLRLTSRASLIKGGDTGPSVDLKQPAESLMLEAIRYESLEMPPSGKLDQETIDLLTQWVMMGVPWSPGVAEPVAGPAEAPERAAIAEEFRSFWSFRPVERPEVPSPRDGKWVRNPVDAFILSKLEQVGLVPAPAASRLSLVRRLHYDLTGLPPTPEQVDAFLSDRAPDAYEKLVDQLLASPAYGERWGRHWLDVVRFAETNSFERDEPKPNAWRYRDYVIGSLNADKPYDRFVREQLAGDELDEVTAETQIATGYYRLGPWDIEPTDVLQAEYDELDDIVSTTGAVFLGLTVNCARCHDHKLDPILQADYYSMLAFFHGVLPTETMRMANKSDPGNTQIVIAGDAERKRYHQERKQWMREKKDLALQIAEIESTLAPLTRESKLPANNAAATPAAGGETPRAEPPQVRPVTRLTQEDLERRTRLQEQLARLTGQLKKLNQSPPESLSQTLGVKEAGAVPPETHVLIRGNAHAEGARVEPAFLSVLDWPKPASFTPPPGGASSGRRRVFADWVADARHPLTSRVIVNRLWQHHFGRGLVRSPNNFGTHGEPPTHPELLDWLAAELPHQQWRLKPLHRLLVTSNTYRMSSADVPTSQKQDPANDFYWRMEMRRLQAEEVRDGILAVSGALNRRMKGPSTYPQIPKEVLQGQSRPGSGWDVSSPGEQTRRSIYVHVKRSLILPVLASFDFADTDVSCPVRFTTTQPTQALGMLNSAFLNEQAGRFAQRLRHEAPESRAAQVELALRLALSRAPGSREIERGVRLIGRLESEHGVPAEQSLAQFCLMVLNLNEFVYLD